MKKAGKHNPNRRIYQDVKSTLNISFSATIIRTLISEQFTQRWMLVEITGANEMYTTKRYKRVHSVHNLKVLRKHTHPNTHTHTHKHTHTHTHTHTHIYIYNRYVHEEICIFYNSFIYFVLTIVYVSSLLLSSENIYGTIYIYIYIRGEYDRFPDFFRMAFKIVVYI